MMQVADSQALRLSLIIAKKFSKKLASPAEVGDVVREILALIIYQLKQLTTQSGVTAIETVRPSER